MDATIQQRLAQFTEELAQQLQSATSGESIIATLRLPEIVSARTDGLAEAVDEAIDRAITQAIDRAVLASIDSVFEQTNQRIKAAISQVGELFRTATVSIPRLDAGGRSRQDIHITVHLVLDD